MLTDPASLWRVTAAVVKRDVLDTATASVMVVTDSCAKPLSLTQWRKRFTGT
jgi:hypothetical protein